MGELPKREMQASVPIPAAAAVGRKKKAPGKSKNVQTLFDLESELTRVCGVNLISIDGIDIMTAQTMAELGTDFSRWKSEAHFSSWLGLSPSRDVSGGKVVKQESRKVNNRVATALRNAANSLFRSDSHLGARYRASPLFHRRSMPVNELRRKFSSDQFQQSGILVRTAH